MVSVTGHFGPGSFRSRVYQPRFVSDRVVSASGHFGPGSFRFRVVSVPGHFDRTSFISVPGRFRPGRFRPCRLFSDHGCICATYIPTYLYLKLVDHFVHSLVVWTETIILSLSTKVSSARFTVCVFADKAVCLYFILF